MPTQALYRNNRDGTFTDVTAGSGLDVALYGMGCCVGDYDNDGRGDLYVTCALEPGRLFRNETPPVGSARFVDVTAAAGVGNDGKWGTSCAWLDYDRDGWLDLFIGNYVPLLRLADDVRCRRGGLRVYCGPPRYEAETSRLYRNLGDGRFLDVTQAAGIGAATAKALGVLVWDYNTDGWPDVMVASDQTRGLLFENSGRGTFAEVGQQVGVAYSQSAIPAAGMGIDAADVRNDGRLAVAVSNFQGEPMSFFYEQEQARAIFEDLALRAGLFRPTFPFVGFGTLFLDYDNSGWKGVFVANGHVEPDIARLEPDCTYSQRKQLFRNRGLGGPIDELFEDVTARSGAALMTPAVGRGAARGDYDNDGDLDLLVTNNGGPAQLLRNDGGNANHWLTLKLTGTRSNRDALGASVTVTAGGIVRRDWVRSGGSYLSQSDLRLHFGLGASRSADRVEIRWPSGRVDRLRDVNADRAVEIRER